MLERLSDFVSSVFMLPGGDTGCNLEKLASIMHHVDALLLTSLGHVRSQKRQLRVEMGENA